MVLFIKFHSLWLSSFFVINNFVKGICKKKSLKPQATFDQQGFGKKIYLMLWDPVFLGKLRFRKVEISDDEKSCVCSKLQVTHSSQWPGVLVPYWNKQLNTPRKPRKARSFGWCFLQINLYVGNILGRRSMRHRMVDQTYRYTTSQHAHCTCTIHLKAPLDRNCQEGANFQWMYVDSSLNQFQNIALSIFQKSGQLCTLSQNSRPNHKNPGVIRAIFSKCPDIQARPDLSGRFGHTALASKLSLLLSTFCNLCFFSSPWGIWTICDDRNVRFSGPLRLNTSRELLSGH